MAHVANQLPSPAHGGTIARIRAMVPSLKTSDRRVAVAILADSLAVIHLTVNDMAEAANTSTATVVRCCQRLGFRGFHDLKLALAQEAAPMRQAVPSVIDERDPPGEILRKVLASDAQAIQDCLGTLDQGAFAAAVDTLASAGRILLLGVGTSAPLAQDAAYRLLTLGLQTEAPADVHVQHVAASLLGRGSACFAISHTGQTRETVSAATAARDSGAMTIGLTSFLHSPLTEVVDLVLVAGSRETSFRLEAMASRVAHISVLDALYVALALRDTERAKAALDASGQIISEHRF